MCSQVVVTLTLLLLIGVSLSELLPAGHPNNWLHCLLHGTRSISYHNTLLQNNRRLMVLLISILDNQGSVVCSYLAPTLTATRTQWCTCTQMLSDRLHICIDSINCIFQTQ